MELGLRDKAVLVTGGTRGIGRAIALAYARDRARVAITYATDEAAATTVVQQIAAEGGSGVAARLDLAEPASIPAAVAQTAERFGGLDVLVANAVRWPIDARGPLAESDPDVWSRALRANLEGTAATVRAALALDASCGEWEPVIESRTASTGRPGQLTSGVLLDPNQSARMSVRPVFGFSRCRPRLGGMRR